MKVVLKKRIYLRCSETYLKIKKETKREDIQKYLHGNKFSNDIVEKRVRNYLKEIGIYNEALELTPAGKKAKECGIVTMDEEGKYRIWFTQNDSHFGNRIFFLKRQKPEKCYGLDRLPIDEYEHFCLSSNKNDYFRFELKNDNLNGTELQSENFVMLSWKWEKLESSIYNFTGNIDDDKISNDIDCEEDLDAKIKEILPDWNRNTSRYKIPLNSVDDNDRISFKCSYNNKWNNFNVQIDNLPIEPYNDSEARQWRNYLLDTKLSKDYFRPKDFENIVDTLNHKDAFSTYVNSLDLPTSEEYRKEINPSKASDRKSKFWHLSAPMDLNPATPKEMIVGQPFSLLHGQKISFSKIAEKIHKDKVEKIFYYDKYVDKEWQQRNLCAFLSAFSYKEAYLITDTSDNNRSSYIKNQSNVKQKNLKEIFKVKNEIPHHRCLILSVEKELEVWIIDDSLDYIHFDGNNVSADTMGKIMRSVTFSNVKVDVLHRKLRFFIEEEVKNA